MHELKLHQQSIPDIHQIIQEIKIISNIHLRLFVTRMASDATNYIYSTEVQYLQSLVGLNCYRTHIIQKSPPPSSWEQQESQFLKSTAWNHLGIHSKYIVHLRFSAQKLSCCAKREEKIARKLHKHIRNAGMHWKCWAEETAKEEFHSCMDNNQRGSSETQHLFINKYTQLGLNAILFNQFRPKCISYMNK